jgi:hypothetical protein
VELDRISVLNLAANPPAVHHCHIFRSLSVGRIQKCLFFVDTFDATNMKPAAALLAIFSFFASFEALHDSHS